MSEHIPLRDVIEGRATSEEYVAALKAEVDERMTSDQQRIVSAHRKIAEGVRDLRRSFILAGFVLGFGVGLLLGLVLGGTS